MLSIKSERAASALRLASLDMTQAEIIDLASSPSYHNINAFPTKDLLRKPESGKNEIN
jgi:hypothetical protein